MVPNYYLKIDKISFQRCIVILLWSIPFFFYLDLKNGLPVYETKWSSENHLSKEINSNIVLLVQIFTFSHDVKRKYIDVTKRDFFIVPD